MKLFTSVKTQCNKSLNDLCKILLLTAVTTLTLYAQPAHNEQILTASGGDAVAMDKEWAVVGDVDNNQTLIYKLNYANMQHDPMDMWELKQTVTAPHDGKFGTSVAISGNNLLIGAPEAGNWRMEVQSLTVDSPNNAPIFKDVVFNQPFETVPAVFILTTKDGKQPAALRINDVTKTGFKVAILEPENEKNPNHNQMKNVHYLAIEKGLHILPNGKKMMVGETTTQRFQEKNNGNSSWSIVNTNSAFTTTPVILAQVQTKVNETATNPPLAFSDPWLTVAIRNVNTDNFELALETSKTNTAINITQDETIAWLAVEEGTVDIGSSILFTVKSNSSVVGWGGTYNSSATCTTVSFPDLGSTALVVASQNSHNEADGGWVRRCRAPSNNDVGLAIDENVDPNVSGDNRDHVAETVGLLAFSGSFSLSLTPGSGEAYLYHYDGTDWTLSQTIVPTTKGNIAFGTAVGIQSDGTDAEIVIGAPDALHGTTPRGKVYAYTWNGTTITLNTTLEGISTHSKKFGASLDIKGDYLIVGAPDEDHDSTTELVGAAYTFKFDGTGWLNHPGQYTHRIKHNIVDEELGTRVAINKDGNVSLIASNGLSNSSSYNYILNVNGTAWEEALEEQNRDGGAVDTDDGVYLMIQKGGHVHFDINPDGTNRPISFFQPDITQMTSAQLYKDQVIVNDPNNGGGQARVWDIPCGVKPTHLIANEWAIISVPCGAGTATIDTIFGDDIGGTYGDSGNWVMYKDGPNYTGKSVDNVIMGSNEEMKLGQGYWIIADHDVTLKADSNAITSRTALTRIVTTTAVVAGYYEATLPDMASNVEKKIMMGNPFPRAFKLAHMAFEAGGGDFLWGAQNEYHKTVYVYDITDPNGTGQPYRAITVTGTPGINGEIKPYQGFWIKDLGALTYSGAKLAIPFEK